MKPNYIFGRLHCEAATRKEEMKQASIVTFTLRMPQPLKDNAGRVAALEHMSMNGWILRVMERACRAEQVKGRIAPTIQPFDEKPTPSKGMEISHGRG